MGRNGQEGKAISQKKLPLINYYLDLFRYRIQNESLFFFFSLSGTCYWLWMTDFIFLSINFLFTTFAWTPELIRVKIFAKKPELELIQMHKHLHAQYVHILG